MDSRYGIGVNNRYALLLDDENEGGEANQQVKKVAPVKAPRTNANAKTANGNKKVAPNSAKNNADAKNNAKNHDKNVNEKNERNKEDKENRGNRFEGKRVLDARKAQEPKDSAGGQANRERRPKPQGDEKVAPGGNPIRNKDERPKGERGNPNRSGGGRGGRGGGPGGPARSGKREFERKSGDDRTGVKAVEKKDGGGSHNWGTFEDEMKAEDDNKANVSADEINTAEKDPENKEVDPNVEVEPKTLTLDEWKAQQGKKEGPKFNVRKAGEGSDMDPKWKKTYAYKKEKPTQEDEEEEEADFYPQRVNRQKRILDIEFNFADNSASSRGNDRGGRGGRRDGPRREKREGGERRGGQGDKGGDRRSAGGKGPGPRGGGGGRGRNPEAPNVNDEASFPSLG